MELDPTFHCDSSPQKHWLNPVKSTKGILIEPPTCSLFFQKTTEIRAAFRRTLVHYAQNKRTFNTFEPLETKPCVPKIPIAVAFAEELDEGNFVNQWTECFF